MDAARELELYRFLAQIEDDLGGVRDVEPALGLALRRVSDFFGAEAAAVARLGAGGELRFKPSSPPGVTWDVAGIGAFLAGRRPRLGPDLLLAPIARRERPWAALCFRRAGSPFGAAAVREIRRIGRIVGKRVQTIDELRIAEARLQIDEKIMRQLRPRDLFYQILHSLRSLIRYDHSAALFVYEPDLRHLRLAAEQIAWRKAKSGRIGGSLGLDAAAYPLLAQGRVVALDRSSGGGDGQPAGALEPLLCALDGLGPTDGRPAKRSILVAPLVSRDGLLGMLELASRHTGSFGPFEARLVERFLPQAAVAIHNLGRAESLEERMLRAERKSVLADLARGVAHDVNNAVGEALPLVQQMRREAALGEPAPGTWARDLESLEASLQACRRIFHGMLQFARGVATGAGQGRIEPALRSIEAVLEERMRRQAVRFVADVPASLPRVRCTQTDLERLLLNLAGNACDAMDTGGELTIRARAEKGRVEIDVRDTGGGIPPELLPRVQEPFFTTKPGGEGLGLAICRSIVEQNRGRLAVQSRAGEGTRVQVSLPQAPMRGETVAAGERPA